MVMLFQGRNIYSITNLKIHGKHNFKMDILNLFYPYYYFIMSYVCLCRGFYTKDKKIIKNLKYLHYYSFYRKLGNKEYIVFSPNTFEKRNGFKIDKHDVERGYVSMTEVEKLLDISNSLFYTLNNDEIFELAKFTPRNLIFEYKITKIYNMKLKNCLEIREY